MAVGVGSESEVMKDEMVSAGNRGGRWLYGVPMVAVAFQLF